MNAGKRDRARPKLPYLVMMGVCLVLFVLSWAVVRRFSTTAAVVMSLIALAIPPLAAIVANAGREDGSSS
jgi:Protein of unknown function (DUF3099)